MNSLGDWAPCSSLRLNVPRLRLKGLKIPRAEGYSKTKKIKANEWSLTGISKGEGIRSLLWGMDIFWNYIVILSLLSIKWLNSVNLMALIMVLSGFVNIFLFEK